MTFGIAHSGECGGSAPRPSRRVPRRRWRPRAAPRPAAASSTTAPRATLMRCAERFIAPRQPRRSGPRSPASAGRSAPRRPASGSTRMRSAIETTSSAQSGAAADRAGRRSRGSPAACAPDGRSAGRCARTPRPRPSGARLLHARLGVRQHRPPESLPLPVAGEMQVARQRQHERQRVLRDRLLVCALRAREPHAFRPELRLVEEFTPALTDCTKRSRCA